MFIITFCALILVSTCLGNSITNEPDFRKYVEDIQSQLDKTVNPCENFGKYACGNFKTGNNNYNMSHLMQQLIEQGLNNYNNKKYESDVEEMMTTFYRSCIKSSDNSREVLKHVDILKSVETWPVTRDFSATEIAKLFGYLSTLDYLQVFSIDRNALSEDNIITIKTNANMYTGNMMAILDKFGVPKDKGLIIFQNLLGFIAELKKANVADSSKTSYDEIQDVTALKEAVPNFDWDTYFITFTNVFDYNLDNFIEKTVKIRNLEELKKTADIIKETDSRTVANYLIWRILDMTFDVQCTKAVEFFMHLTNKYLSDNGSRAKQYFMNELEVLSHFEKSFLEINSQLNNPQSKRMNQILHMKKIGYENYEKFISGKYLLELFNGFEINEDTFYSNIIHIMQTANKDLTNHGNFEIFGDVMWQAIEKFVKLENVSNPFLRNFIKVNYKLWSLAISFDNISKNRTINDNCFPYENKLDNYRNKDYINFHAAYYLALHGYLNYIDERTNEFKKQTEILTEAGLNHIKLYMLTLAQDTCKDSVIKDNNLLVFSKHSKDFSDTWGCVAGDLINDLCDESTFIPKFKKSS